MRKQDVPQCRPEKGPFFATIQQRFEYPASRIVARKSAVDIAIEERDHASSSYLNWFVDEQVEEEASADAVVQKLKLMADAPGGLFMLDQELGQRVFVMPAATEGGT